jgi:hypothetical protein
MIENIPCATLETTTYFEGVSTAWHHRKVLSGIQICSTNFHWIEVEIFQIFQIFPSSVVQLEVNWNRACQWSISVLYERFIWLSFRAHCTVISMLHYCSTNHKRHNMIDQIIHPLRRGQNCYSIQFRVYWPAHVDVWQSIVSTHTSEMLLGIR